MRRVAIELKDLIACLKAGGHISEEMNYGIEREVYVAAKYVDERVHDELKRAHENLRNEYGVLKGKLALLEQYLDIELGENTKVTECYTKIFRAEDSYHG